MNEQADLNRKEFDHLEDNIRVQYEGFRAGMYVRIEVCKYLILIFQLFPVLTYFVYDCGVILGSVCKQILSNPIEIFSSFKISTF